MVVTGATGTVGWGIAHAALEAGARLVLPVRSASARGELEREFGSALDRVAVVLTDFGDEARMAGVRDDAVRRFGAIDHVIAPLGAWWQKGASLDQPAAELRALLGVYVEAQWLLVATFAPALRVSRGSYTFVTGALGEADYRPGLGLLVVAVKAQLGLCGVLRRELKDEPFRINEVRVNRRIEREPRPGVVASRALGAAMLEAAQSPLTGRLFRYEAAGLMLDDEARAKP